MPTATAKVIERISVPFWKPYATVPPLSATELQQRYLRSVLKYVWARIGEGTEAEDITAEVFAAAFTALRSCPRPTEDTRDDPVRAWLFGIARRKLADVYRRRTRRPEVALEVNHFLPDRRTPETSLLSDEASRTLQMILNELPEMQREAILLKYIEELSVEEIGRVLGKSANAICQLLHRARQTIRQRGSDYFSNDFADEETIR